MKEVYAILLLTCAMSGCLKTRAQLKNEEVAYNGPGLPTKTTEVQASGQFDELRAELTRLTGKVDELDRTQNERNLRQEAQQSESLKKIEMRLKELEVAQIELIESLKRLQASVPPPDQVALYEKAKALIAAKDFDEAIEALSTYLKNPSGKFAEQATFLRGEAYFAKKLYQKALLDYTKFPEKYRDSKLMPQVLYRIGKSFEGLDSREDAKAFYQELVEKFPNSKEAQLVAPKKKPAKPTKNKNS